MNKHVEQQIKSLERAVEDKTILGYSVEGKEFIVEFNGPYETPYNKTYKVKFILAKEHPFKPAQGFFIGEAPDHPYYSFDKDDANRPKRTTNIANTDFGLTYEVYSPLFCIPDYIKLIQKSLTVDGAKQMENYMMVDKNYL